jgi:hypothetical protein
VLSAASRVFDSELPDRGRDCNFYRWSHHSLARLKPSVNYLAIPFMVSLFQILFIYLALILFFASVQVHNIVLPVSARLYFKLLHVQLTWVYFLLLFT